jgi:hypothetical protein
MPHKSAPTQVAAIYFPSWHSDPRRDNELGAGFTEWQLVKDGKPRFDGHYQPIEPLWGHADETETMAMQRSCDAAARAGIHSFLWDWYWYEEADYLNRPLDETYLGLTEPGVGFALMWANHDWADVFPARTGVTPEVLHPGAVTEEAFVRMMDVVIARYFASPQYWRVDGAAWFTIYRLDVLLDGLGGVEATMRLLAEFRHKAEVAGVGALHFNVLDGWQALAAADIANLGIDSVGHYNWASVLPKDKGLDVDYAGWRTAAVAQWHRDHANFVEKTDGALRYIPNITMGWDSSARVSQDDQLIVSEWPFLPIVTGNTPGEFGQSCQAAHDFAAATTAGVVIVNAWNEWTEGSYLEPDKRYEYGYIQALAAVFRTQR